jgi:Fic family protein
VAPDEEFLRNELVKFIEYANDASKIQQHFVHPLIKAIILHFWLGYLHPFTDGNGRLARSIFYWYMLKHDYWAFSYLPVSRAIKNSPAQYRDAYIYSEQDDNDLTYFIDYNVRKIGQCMVDFERYFKRKMAENQKMLMKARRHFNLNDRQIQLLKYMHKDASATTTIKTHSVVNGVSRVTAGNDLESLEDIGFLTSRKVGRERRFIATEKLNDLF